MLLAENILTLVEFIDCFLDFVNDYQQYNSDKNLVFEISFVKRK